MAREQGARSSGTVGLFKSLALLEAGAAPCPLAAFLLLHSLLSAVGQVGEGCCAMCPHGCSSMAGVGSLKGLSQSARWKGQPVSPAHLDHGSSALTQTPSGPCLLGGKTEKGHFVCFWALFFLVSKLSG